MGNYQISFGTLKLQINFFGQAVVFLPIPCGFAIGYAKYFMSAITIYACGQSIVVLEQLTVIILFFYRYQTVHNVTTISHSWKFFLFILFLIQVANTYLPLSIQDKTEATFKRLAKVRFELQ